jgi:uncharacterized protein (TIGR03000 family)
VVIIQQPAPAPAPKPEEKKKASAYQATVTIGVPDEAALFVNGQRVSMNAATQSFDTPALTPGRTYHYTMKAVAVRGGDVVSESKRVTVRAGETVRVAFRGLKVQEPAASVSRLTVKLPADAKLYVDGVRCPLTTATRTFDTPDLEQGRKYTYTLKAEVVRNGRAVSEIKNVLVQAGKKVNVEFRLAPDQAARR